MRALPASDQDRNRQQNELWYPHAKLHTLYFVTPGRLGIIYSAKYHSRFLTEIGLLLVRRTRKRASFSIGTGKWAGFKHGAGCLFDPADPGRAVCLSLIGGIKSDLVYEKGKQPIHGIGFWFEDHYFIFIHDRVIPAKQSI